MGWSLIASRRRPSDEPPHAGSAGAGPSPSYFQPAGRSLAPPYPGAARERNRPAWHAAQVQVVPLHATRPYRAIARTTSATARSMHDSGYIYPSSTRRTSPATGAPPRATEAACHYLVAQSSLRPFRESLEDASDQVLASADALGDGEVHLLRCRAVRVAADGTVVGVMVTVPATSAVSQGGEVGIDPRPAPCPTTEKGATR